MKDLIFVLIMQIPTIILSGGAVWMGVNDVEGWGWMLLAALLILATTRVKIN